MPLPDRNMDWPPPSLREVSDLYARYGAWFSGDAEQLAAAYSQFPGLAGAGGGIGDDLPRGQPGNPGGRFMSGLLRGAQRVFWGTPISAGQVRSHKVHVPLAADIASTSADLLYGEPPAFEIPDAPKDDPTQTRLDELLDEAGAAAVWLEAGEVAAAYGGAYIRVRWDLVISPDCPLLDVIPPTSAVPEFRSGRLAAVTFWRLLARPDGRTWIHLERHEPGRILHGLYASAEAGKLGRRMDLVDHDETAAFAMLLDAGSDDTITTGATGLTAEYHPNIRPNRTMPGSPYGRSDYAGAVEGMLDSLDEAWTSWLRDLRIGKGRIVVPRQYTKSRGRGQGAVFDPEQEVFEAIDVLDNGDASALKLEVVQFQIRVDEHDRTCRALVENAVRGAGYSAQAFGEVDQVAATATEVNSRDSRSMRTRGKKALYAKAPLQRIGLTLLQVWAAQMKPAGVADVKTDVRPKVTWPDGVAPDPQALAQTLQLLDAAKAISTYRKVKERNPDWDEPAIEEEVARIMHDNAPPIVVDPGSTGTGHGPSGPAAGGDHAKPAPPGSPPPTPGG